MTDSLYSRALGRVIVLENGVAHSVIRVDTGEEVGFTHVDTGDHKEGHDYVLRFGEFTISLRRETQEAFEQRAMSIADFPFEGK